MRVLWNFIKNSYWSIYEVRWLSGISVISWLVNCLTSAAGHSDLFATISNPHWRCCHLSVDLTFSGLFQYKNTKFYCFKIYIYIYSKDERAPCGPKNWSSLKLKLKLLTTRVLLNLASPQGLLIFVWQRQTSPLIYRNW